MTAMVVTVALVSLALQLTVLRWLIEPAFQSLSRSVAQNVNAVHLLMARAPVAERARLAKQLSGDDLFVQTHRSGRQHASTSAPTSSTARELEHAFKGRLSPGIAVRLIDDPPTMAAFDFELEGQGWCVLHQARPPQWGLVGLGLGWLMLLVAATWVSLLVGGLWIARPLSRLAHELASQSDSLRMLDVRGLASAELTHLVSAFNRVVDKAQQAEARRRVQLAGVSHDLAAPLTRMRLRVETQCDDALGQALMGDLAMVQRVAAQLIEFVQGEAGPLHGHPVAAQHAAAEVVARYAQHGDAVRLLTGNHDVRLPDTALHRVLDNLISNALAHAAGPVEVTVEERASAAAAGREAVLTVWDHGPGLSDSDFTRAQRPFVRLGRDGATDAPGGHCGLGLAIVAQIAHHLGGGLEPRRDKQGRFGVAMVWPVDATARSAP